jgi:hypothetical protein
VLVLHFACPSDVVSASLSNPRPMVSHTPKAMNGVIPLISQFRLPIELRLFDNPYKMSNQKYKAKL